MSQRYCVEGGAFAPKSHLKSVAWIEAYERRNVDLGLA